MSHAMTASPKPSLKAAWRLGDAVVGRGNAGWTSLKGGHPCPCQLFIMASCKKDWKRISAESSTMSPRQPGRSGDWTVVNKHRLYEYHLNFITVWIPSKSHLICPLTARVVGAPQIISQPVSSIFPCSPLPSGTWRTPGLSIPWCCSPIFSSVWSCLNMFSKMRQLAEENWPTTTASLLQVYTTGCWATLWRFREI